MSDPTDSLILAQLCRAGDGDAARKLFDRYVDRLVALARRRLSQSLASRVDPEDIVQSVFRTFFCRLQEGRFQLEQQDDLCKLLVRITVHKTLRQVAFQTAAKRSPSAEAGQENAERDELFAVLDREPSPEEAVMFLDQLEHFLSGLNPEERRILEMKVNGYSNEDICQDLGIYDRKIRRVLERIRGLAEQEGLSPAAARTPVSPAGPSAVAGDSSAAPEGKSTAPSPPQKAAD
jgi:RNA polymerase sigma factor (sigma-70 family)